MKDQRATFEQEGNEPHADLAALFGAARLAYFTPVREYPPLADRKCATMLSLNGLMVTVACLFFDEIRAAMAIGSPVRYAVFLLGLMWFVVVIIGAAYAFLALSRPLIVKPYCVAHFNTIASKTAHDYKSELEELSHHDALRNILDYNYSVAVLSTEKFSLIRRSVICLCLSLTAWMLVLLLLALRAAHFWAY